MKARLQPSDPKASRHRLTGVAHDATARHDGSGLAADPRSSSRIKLTPQMPIVMMDSTVVAMGPTFRGLQARLADKAYPGWPPHGADHCVRVSLGTYGLLPRLRSYGKEARLHGKRNLISWTGALPTRPSN
jgi:hypothetical protein